jgi:hypothetical protein
MFEVLAKLCNVGGVGMAVSRIDGMALSVSGVSKAWKCLDVSKAYKCLRCEHAFEMFQVLASLGNV